MEIHKNHLIIILVQVVLLSNSNLQPNMNWAHSITSLDEGLILLYKVLKSVDEECYVTTTMRILTLLLKLV